MARIRRARTSQLTRVSILVVAFNSNGAFGKKGGDGVGLFLFCGHVIF